VDEALTREVADALWWRRAELVYMRCMIHDTAEPLDVRVTEFEFDTEASA
jgi:hypothetical protein